MEKKSSGVWTDENLQQPIEVSTDLLDSIRDRSLGNLERIDSSWRDVGHAAGNDPGTHKTQNWLVAGVFSMLFAAMLVTTILGYGLVNTIADIRELLDPFLGLLGVAFGAVITYYFTRR